MVAPPGTKGWFFAPTSKWPLVVGVSRATTGLRRPARFAALSLSLSLLMFFLFYFLLCISNLNLILLLNVLDNVNSTKFLSSFPEPLGYLEIICRGISNIV